MNEKKIFLCIYYSNIFPSVLWQLLWVLVGRLPACKKLGVGLLMVTFWLELCTSYSSSCHHRLYYPITLSWNKIQNGDVLVPANPGPSGKWPLKRRDSRLGRVYQWRTLIDYWCKVLHARCRYCHPPNCVKDWLKVWLIARCSAQIGYNVP